MIVKFILHRNLLCFYRDTIVRKSMVIHHSTVSIEFIYGVIERTIQFQLSFINIEIKKLRVTSLLLYASHRTNLLSVLK